jgi:hypothetical protein
MEIAIIKYGENYADNQTIRDWCKKLGCHNPIIINNKTSHLLSNEIAGDNSCYEFSAYKMALSKFKGEGPFLIVNDSLFKHHLPAAWAQMVKKANQLKVPAPSVWGDQRKEDVSFPEKEKEFLASWIFYIPDRASLQTFQKALDEAIASVDLPLSPGYKGYIDQWLNGKKWLRGWKGPMDDETYKRKLLSIRLEHGLSKSLSSHGVMRSFGQITMLYRITRWAERMLYRFTPNN